MHIERIPDTHNLSVYLLLPLIGLSRNSFDNFLNSYLSYNGKVIIKVEGIPEGEYWLHPFYLTDYSEEDNTYIVYRMSPAYTHEVSCFLEGKYSRFSDEAKRIIFKGSTLQFNIPSPEGITSHGLLMALAGNPKRMENRLDVKLPANVELWDKPNLDKEIIDIDTDIAFT